MDAVLEAHFRAEHDADIEAIMRTYADEVEFDLAGNPEGVLRDKAAIRVFYNILFGDLAELQAQPIRRLYGNSHVVDESLISARAIGRPFGLDGQGRRVQFRLLHVFEFTGGRISRENGWLDMAAILHQLS
ncbi:MAG TPA: nuclear transport factor 2 family protein [Chloroflexota bacterium]|nr:nuclear transport factor 2 family protein [Chloroflexota bacterium]